MTTENSKPHDTDADAKKHKHDLKTAVTHDKTKIGAITGVGAGIAAGAAIGSFAPGLGTVVGAIVGGAIGAATGGLAGTAIGSEVDAMEYEAYWRAHYIDRPYAQGMNYATLEPAYRHGWQARARHGETTRWEDVEQDLSHAWEGQRQPQDLEWREARHAARDAWNTVLASDQASTST